MNTSLVHRFTLALYATALLSGCSGTVGSTPNTQPSRSPSSPIQHVVIMMQENRSFDNLFAGFPGADTAMEGLCKKNAGRACPVPREVPLKPIPLAEGLPPSQDGVGKDICHSHQCFKLECDLDKATNICRNDGFNLIDFGEIQDGQKAGLYPYAYVKHSDVKAYWDLAREYTIADRFFFTDTASSFIAHQEILSGTVALDDEKSLTDEPNATPWGCDAPGPHSGKLQETFTPVLFRDGHEIFDGPFPCFDEYGTLADLLDAHGVSWRFYTYNWNQNSRYYDFSGTVWNGYDAIKKIRYGPDWKTNITWPNTRFFSDIKSGTLPALSYVIPTLENSDHPGSGCNGGPRWVTQVVNAVGTSQYWKNTAIILFWDDWGGWFDNVPPPQINYTSLGFRVPMIVISPFAKPHNVAHTEYTYGSILKFVEQTFGLGSLGTTDVNANSLANIFNFKQKANVFHAARLPGADKCADSTTTPAEDREIIEKDGAPPS